MSKFFTYEERLTLQKELRESHSLKSIAKLLGKDPTTISREIKKYSSEVATGYPGYPYNAWDFIHFHVEDTKGSYVALSVRAETWWDEYGTEAMEILATIKITEGVDVEYLD